MRNTTVYQRRQVQKRRNRLERDIKKHHLVGEVVGNKTGNRLREKHTTVHVHACDNPPYKMHALLEDIDERAERFVEMAYSGANIGKEYDYEAGCIRYTIG